MYTKEADPYYCTDCNAFTAQPHRGIAIKIWMVDANSTSRVVKASAMCNEKFQAIPEACFHMKPKTTSSGTMIIDEAVHIT